MYRDASGRCIVGYFNICPKALDVQNTNKPLTIEVERRLALHELWHCFGGIRLDNFKQYRNANERYLPASSSTWELKHNVLLGKDEVHVRTPKVLAKWREQTNCSSSSGPVLEDTPAGVGAHWEARQFGPEFMSYGLLSVSLYHDRANLSSHGLE